MTLKVLITGAGGMLGTDLANALNPLHQILGVGRNPAPHLKTPYVVTDLSDFQATRNLIQSEKPDLIFHAAAMTNVDGCEQNRELAFKNNADATRYIVECANETKSFVVFFSTDYVFDGSKTAEYAENDPTRPINIYGESKLFAETYMREYAQNYVIIRLSWLYGIHGKSFVRTILERAHTQQRFEVVNDQFGRPTYTKDIAFACANLLKNTPSAFQNWNRETFHFGNSESANWAQFAEYILAQAGHREAQVIPISSEKLGRLAKRPNHSILSLQKAQAKMGLAFRSWQSAFSDFLKEFQAQESPQRTV